MFPALIRVLVNYAHSGILSDGRDDEGKPLAMTDFAALQGPGCHVVLAMPNTKALWPYRHPIPHVYQEGSRMLQSSSLPITITYLEAKW
jgi:hypothetical protein